MSRKISIDQHQYRGWIPRLPVGNKGNFIRPHRFSMPGMKGGWVPAISPIVKRMPDMNQVYEELAKYPEDKKMIILAEIFWNIRGWLLDPSKTKEEKQDVKLYCDGLLSLMDDETRGQVMNEESRYRYTKKGLKSEFGWNYPLKKKDQWEKFKQVPFEKMYYPYLYGLEEAPQEAIQQVYEHYQKGEMPPQLERYTEFAKAYRLEHPKKKVTSREISQAYRKQFGLVDVAPKKTRAAKTLLTEEVIKPYLMSFPQLEKKDDYLPAVKAAFPGISHKEAQSIAIRAMAISPPITKLPKTVRKRKPKVSEMVIAEPSDIIAQ